MNRKKLSQLDETQKKKYLKRRKRRRIGWSVTAAVLIVVIVAACIAVPKLDTGGYSKVAGYALSSFVKKSTNPEVDALLAKTQGFVKGVCHPNENYPQIAAANIEWVRFDITSLPYDADGNPSESYQRFKERARGYAERGFKVMAITPYPEVYIEAGLDPRDAANDAKIEEYARFFATDLQGIVSAFQITNEMGIEHFTLPLTLEEAGRFIGIQLRAMFPVRGDIIIGYNCAGFTMYTLNAVMQPYFDYCDYIALDLYLGCFEDMFKELWIYDAILRFMWSYSGKPILVNEFGYMGAGDIKTDEQKQAILRQYGAENEQQARENIVEFVNKLPPKFRDHMLSLDCKTDAELADKLFNTELANHLYLEIQGGYQLNDYRHTWEDQGRFFTDTLKRFEKLDFVCGAFVYCYSDSGACYICGQNNCPVETGWGLVDCDGNPKPAYYTVQGAFADFRKEK